MGWKAIARSAVGTSHQEQKIPCQDCGHYRIFNDVIVGAVADGAGSAKYSHFGSELAVKTTIKYLCEINEHLQKRKELWTKFCQPLSPIKAKELLTKKKFSEFNEYIQKRKEFCTVVEKALSQIEAKELFTKTVNQVIIALHKQAASKGYSVHDLACTLLVFIATPDWVAAMQIGDGFILVRCQDLEYQLLFEPDKGEFFNETTFVTSVNALQEMQVQVISGKQEFICASTDGLEKVAIRLSDWKPFPPFFKPFEEYLRETDNLEDDDKYVNDFLNSERLNSRTDDDKTLLLCFFKPDTIAVNLS